MNVFLTILCLLMSVSAEESNEEIQVHENPDEGVPSSLSDELQTSGKSLESGKSFGSHVPFPPVHQGIEAGYGYIPPPGIPPHGQFYPVPGPYHPHPHQANPYFGGSVGYPNYPNIYGGPYHKPYYTSNYLQSYDLIYGGRSNNM